ncbi:unnamed protein product [Bursaphelenchus okinawaensis]|uniref:Uncharacterized protein n=1 Tax=Bursaphelenchus okinawaensis TaxID=465554 RepID=A0A811LQX0_9BILA|nr:unnamed protein product [Bursaphelenchus okinawaensis]CAG9127901.1 unnamed protein product [Bursaphelenchus okinawaensis]
MSLICDQHESNVTKIQNLKVCHEEKGQEVVDIDPVEEYEDLEWILDEPSPQFPSGKLGYVIDSNFDSERLRPLHAYQVTDDRLIELPDPVDYLIAWSDSNCAIGFVYSNNHSKNPDVPMSIRFGGYWATSFSDRMYAGCLVRVKQYVMVSKFNHTDLVDLKMGGKRYIIKDFFMHGTPLASAFAIEWAVVKQPEISRSLGVIMYSELVPRKDTRLEFYGIVGDEEYQQKIDVPHERWPFSLKEVPKVARPVVLNWVYMDIPHVLLPSNQAFVILPAHMRNFYRHIKEVSDDRFIFGWVDLAFEASRKYKECKAKPVKK